MENKAIAKQIKLFAQLLELYGENSFRTRAVANAAFTIDKLPFKIVEKTTAEIESIKGIGKSLASKIEELKTNGFITELKNLIENTPPGVIEMLSLKGLGPKKIEIIWKNLNIENLGELYYACNENRLIEAKGFGLKTQQEILKLIEFKMASNGKFLYAQAQPIALNLFEKISIWLNQFKAGSLLGIAGEYRRAFEIINELNFIIGAEDDLIIESELSKLFDSELTYSAEKGYQSITPEGLKFYINIINKDNFYKNYFELTGSEEHVSSVLKLTNKETFDSEEEIYTSAGLAFIEPELRENLGEIELSKSGKLPELITFKDIKGALHNHSTWSDGVHTLNEMAIYCKDSLKLEYLGISDHSKSAFYARGLTEQQIVDQHLEIDKINSTLSPFKIFKGIESDILYDGSLDYSDDVLKSFDFVVASVHSNLKMNEEKATERLIKAIENPYTTILGHPTGRLLLSRTGYPIDFKKVIDACAANRVVIEINANPLRLDLDWRWHRYALEKGVILSINPDAHRNEGFMDMQYGIHVARKGGLTSKNCLNCMNLSEITEFFKSK